MKPKLRRRPTAYCILVDIDMLLESRIGVLESLYPKITAKLLQKNYGNRFNDNFGSILPQINQKLFEDTYAKRNKTHLMEAGPTGFMMWLAMEAENVLKQSTTEHIYDEFYIDVNLSKYKDLDKDERKEIIETLGDVFPPEFGIEEVSIIPENLTPAFLNANYNQMMIYNYSQWWEFHYPVLASHDVLLNNKMPDCDVFAPGLFKNHVKIEDTIIAMIEGGEETPVLEIQVRAVSSFFTLNYVHPGVCSLIDPLELEKMLGKKT